ncbi:MAG TPA: ABC transporter substrate-binding protein [Solirubrobacteraceae bacterium]|nr:ABC transporter substrate-binding protein [Solirubrobacteraceae bacterium]
MTRIPSLSAVLLLLAAAWALAGCGGTDEAAGPSPTPATLVLDFAPNAVHAGTYLATTRGYDREAGVRLTVQAPSSSTDAVKLLRAGRADLAYLDIHDLAIADERSPGALVAVMALVQRPLAAVLAAPDVSRPRDLAGRRAGVTGLPSDRAVLASIVRGDGGDPDAVREVTIGFQAVPALLAGRVAAATAFWNAEGVALRRRRPATRIFKVDEFGAPAYPELVLVTTPARLRARRALVTGAVAALRRGYAGALAEPGAALDALVAGAPGVGRSGAARELAAVAPAFTAPGRPFGVLDRRTLAAWATWEQRFGIVRERPAVARLFDLAVARSGPG